MFRRGRKRFSKMCKKTPQYEYKLILKQYQVRTNILTMSDYILLRRAFSFSLEVELKHTVELIDGYFEMLDGKVDAKYILTRYLTRLPAFYGKDKVPRLEFEYIILGATTISPKIVLSFLMEKEFDVQLDGMDDAIWKSKLKQIKTLIEEQDNV